MWMGTTQVYSTLRRNQREAIGRRERSDRGEVGCGQRSLDSGLLVNGHADGRGSGDDGGTFGPVVEESPKEVVVIVDSTNLQG